MEFTGIPEHLLDDIFDTVEVLNKYNKKEILYKKRYDMVVKELTRDYNTRGRSGGLIQGGMCRGNYAFYIFNYYLKNKRYLKRYRAEIWKRKDYVNVELKTKFKIIPNIPNIPRWDQEVGHHSFLYRTLKREEFNGIGWMYFKFS